MNQITYWMDISFSCGYSINSLNIILQVSATNDMIQPIQSNEELPQSSFSLNIKSNPNRRTFPQVSDRQASSGTTESGDEKQFEDDAEFAETLLNLESKLTARNSSIFGVLMMITQIGICLTFGFAISLPSMSVGASLNLIDFTANLSPSEVGQLPNMAPITINILTMLACLCGLSLLTAYNKKLVWSSLGINILITSLTVQLYFIFNNLTARVSSSSAKMQTSQFHIYLSNFEDHFNQNKVLVGGFGNTLIDAVRAAFANCILYSCIIGRAGFLQAYFVCVFGTIGYCICKMILLERGVDFGDACSIFVFGGTAGLVSGSFLFFKYRRQALTSTRQHELNTANVNSIAFSIMGSGILTALLPVLALHPSRQQLKQALGTYLQAPYSIYHSATSAVLCCTGTSILINQKLNVRDFVNSPISGAIAALCSSYFITIPVYSQIVGAAAGIVQALVQNFMETKVARKYDILTTYSFCLFGIQGLMGAMFGSIFKSLLARDLQNQSTYDLLKIKALAQPALLGAIATGIGLVTGTVIGTLMFFSGAHNRADNFCDRIYWGDIEDDSFLEEDSKLIISEARKDSYRPEHII